MNLADAPLVTVTFIAWQRREALRRGIESCVMQSYPRIEILVVDNSPTDEIHQWLLQAFPQVKSIKTARPISLPAARNLAVATAAGEYVVFHDDDSRFSSPHDVERAVDYIRPRHDVACLAFRVRDADGSSNPQFDLPEPQPVYIYIACATLFRRADYRAAGGYFEDFWLYGEERILSLGFFGLGKEIHLLPGVTIIHEYERTGRARDNGARYWTCDVVMIAGAALLRFPFPEVLWWYPTMLVFYTLQVALLRGRPLLAVKALGIALCMLPTFLRQRAAISRNDYRRWRATRAAQQRDYLQRVGRWRWYHELLPAVG